MILPFSTQFKDGTPTHFISKIWHSLLGFDNYEELYWSMYSVISKVDSLDSDLFAENVVPKPHTIREDIHDRWHEGSLIHPVVFNRSKNQFQFAPTLVCKSTQKIEIIRTSDYLNETIVKIDGRKLLEKEIQQLAWNDGFSNLIGFWLWFQDGFTGKIIHWTNLKY
jgi:hypothetical protein